MKRRTVALLLSLVMAVCCLSGCTSTRVRSYTEESGNAATDKYAAAVSAYGSNKKVMTVNGSPVYWNEYAYFLCAILANMERYGMQVSDWSAVYDESSQSTYADLMTESIVNNIAWNHLIEVKAAENDVTFDAAGEQFVQDTVDQTIRNVVGDGGTETELNEKLRSYHMDLDLFKYFTKVQYLYNALAEKLFGADGASITDEDVQEFAEANSYTTAKHILLKTIDDSGKAIADDEKAAKRRPPTRSPRSSRPSPIRSSAQSSLTSSWPSTTRTPAKTATRTATASPPAAWSRSLRTPARSSSRMRSPAWSRASTAITSSCACRRRAMIWS